MAEKKMTDWHRKVLCNFDNAWSATQDMREQIIEAQRFVRVSGAQWEGSTNAGYSFDEGRFEHYPRFELNKIARECDRIIGEYRQNRISVKFRPKDDKASEALAEKMNGKFRADYQETSGGEACDNAFDDAVTGGFGCFRMCADYEDEMDPSNEQRRISLLPVYDPATCVFFDQDSKQYDRSDAMWAMEMFSMTPKAFEAEYPDSIAASLSRDDTGTQYDWSTPDAIYVGRYYEVRIEKVKLTAWRNPVSGETAIYDEEQIKDIVDELTDGAFELIGERTVKKRRVYCGLLSGAEWLEEPKRIPGEHIPLIPVYGRRSFVDNQERIEGHAAKAMDAQRLENLMVSMIADNATQAGGDGIPIVDVDFIPGPLMNHWAERNKKRPAVLPMTSKKDKNGTVISEAQVAGWTPPTQMPPALAGLLQYTGTAIQQITGASQLENMPSNVATDTVDSIFNRMDTQSYIYMDNMAKSMRRAGVVWLSMAREVYGSDTPMRIVNEDGSDDVALMTGEVVDRQTGKVIALNDLSQGNYEVTVDVGQSFANQLAKDLEIMFENYVEGFEAACVVSRNAKKFRPGDTAMQRAGDVLYRPQHYHMNIEEGLDLSGKTPTALVQRLVPSVFKEPKNILYTLDAREMRDPEHKTEAGRAAGMRLAAQIDSDLISMVTQRATNVITMADSTTGSQGRDLWNCAAGIDATMTAIGVPQGINRRSFWNPFNYKDLAGELGHRAYAQGATLTAYEKAQIPPVASFDSYKTDISGRVPKGTATSITLAAAPAHKVEAKDANDMPVDNRQGTITVSLHGQMMASL
ncbi:portal protein [Escherichia coli]|uniref:portal protein n=20 Tax=Enterobacteriaceae TaxID=543 RepID=UPI000B501C38|nr:portal protein [Escherichia coli]